MNDFEFFLDGTLTECQVCGYVLWHSGTIAEGQNKLKCLECDETTVQETIGHAHEGGVDE